MLPASDSPDNMRDHSKETDEEENHSPCNSVQSALAYTPFANPSSTPKKIQLQTAHTLNNPLYHPSSHTELPKRTWEHPPKEHFSSPLAINVPRPVKVVYLSDPANMQRLMALQGSPNLTNTACIGRSGRWDSLWGKVCVGVSGKARCVSSRSVRKARWCMNFVSREIWKRLGFICTWYLVIVGARLMGQ